MDYSPWHNNKLLALGPSTRVPSRQAQGIKQRSTADLVNPGSVMGKYVSSVRAFHQACLNCLLQVECFMPMSFWSGLFMFMEAQDDWVKCKSLHFRHPYLQMGSIHCASNPHFFLNLAVSLILSTLRACPNTTQKSAAKVKLGQIKNRCSFIYRNTPSPTLLI